MNIFKAQILDLAILTSLGGELNLQQLFVGIPIVSVDFHLFSRPRNVIEPKMVSYLNTNIGDIIKHRKHKWSTAAHHELDVCNDVSLHANVLALW